MSIKNRIFFIGSQCVNKQSQDFACQYEALFPSQWPMNMIKVLLCRFKQCFINVYHIASRRVLSKGNFFVTTFSESLISELQKLWGSSFFSKSSKFRLDFKKAEKLQEKVFCFSDNFVWIGMVKFCLLRTGFFSSLANVLTNSPKIWHVNKRDFFELTFLASDQ